MKWGIVLNAIKTYKAMADKIVWYRQECIDR